MTVDAVLEVAAKRSFASALDWPGWSRGGRTPDDALEALVAYGSRYAAVAARAGLTFEIPASVDAIEVIERARGGSGTEFGVPGSAASAEAIPISPHELKRLMALLEAAWATFDRVAAAAEGVPLRLGPRGGGRQVPKIVGHVHESEAAYLHQLGWKVPNPRPPMDDLRRSFVEAVRLRAAGRPLPEPNKVHQPWEPRYAIRRSAWHALDHAWEIEDRSTPGG